MLAQSVGDVEFLVLCRNERGRSNGMPEEAAPVALWDSAANKLAQFKAEQEQAKHELAIGKDESKAEQEVCCCCCKISSGRAVGRLYLRRAGDRGPTKLPPRPPSTAVSAAQTPLTRRRRMSPFPTLPWPACRKRHGPTRVDDSIDRSVDIVGAPNAVAVAANPTRSLPAPFQVSISQGNQMTVTIDNAGPKKKQKNVGLPL